MFEIGRVCIKISGKDSGKVVVVVDTIDDKYVIIDGNVKRKKCNITHLEPLPQEIKIKKGAPTSTVISSLSAIGIKIIEKKPKKLEKKPKPKKKRKIKEKPKKITKK